MGAHHPGRRLGAGGPEQRWAALARSWLELPRLPGLIGHKDDGGRLISALSDGVRRPLAPRDRRRVLAGLAELPAGVAPGSVAGLAELLAWRAPRRGGRLRDEVAGWVVTEATVLGVVALDAISTPGRALLEDPDRLIPALRATLPEPVDHVLLQADLTAVAPGPLEPLLAAELELMAEVESAGGATVYRFTESTVRRALDAGRSVADLHLLLRTRSATPVPQALTYLLDDVARRHGRLRGGTAASFLRSDDEVLIAEVMAHPQAAELELRRIAPTVAVSELPLVELMDGLRAAGFSPAAEDTGGAVLDLTDRGRRTAPRRRPAARLGVPAEPDAEHLAALVSRLRAGDALSQGAPGCRAARSRQRIGASSCCGPRWPSGGPSGSTSWTAAGSAGELVLEPIRVGAGVVEGRDAVDGMAHRVPLHRITSIAPVEERPNA